MPLTSHMSLNQAINHKSAVLETLVSNETKLAKRSQITDQNFRKEANAKREFFGSYKVHFKFLSQFREVLNAFPNARCKRICQKPNVFGNNMKITVNQEAQLEKEHENTDDD